MLLIWQIPVKALDLVPTRNVDTAVQYRNFLFVYVYFLKSHSITRTSVSSHICGLVTTNVKCVVNGSHRNIKYLLSKNCHVGVDNF